MQPNYTIDMENEKLPIGMVVVGMLKSMFRVVESRAYEQTGIKLTMPQFALLHTISQESEEVILKDVAEKMGKDKSAIVRMVDQLERKELLRRVVDQSDRRKNLLFVTKKGERLLTDFIEIELLLNQELQTGLSVDDLQAFYRTVNHLKQKSEQIRISDINHC